MRNDLKLIILILLVLSSFGCAARDYQLMQPIERANAEDWLYSANLLYRTKNYGEAMDYYEKIIETYPGSIYADTAKKRLERAETCHRRSLVGNNMFKVLTMHLKKYEALRGMDRDNAEKWLEAADLSCRIKNYSDAINYYEKIITTYPGSVYAYLADKKLNRVKRHYVRSIKVD